MVPPSVTWAASYADTGSEARVKARTVKTSVRSRLRETGPRPDLVDLNVTESSSVGRSRIEHPRSGAYAQLHGVLGLRRVRRQPLTLQRTSAVREATRAARCA